MSQYYAEIQGAHDKVSRTGTKVSGMWSHVRGWDIGGRVEMLHLNGKDVCRLYVTYGSNGKGEDRLIASFTAETLETLEWDQMSTTKSAILGPDFRDIRTSATGMLW